MAIETEIKFSVKEPAVFGKIHAPGVIAGFALSEIRDNPHEDTYFDTHDYILFKNLVVLRLRKSRKGKTITFKAQNGDDSHETIRRRIEIETSADYTPDDITAGKADNEPPLRELYERTGKIKLVQVLSVKNARQTVDICRNDLKICEMVFDSVVFSGPGGEKKIYELEIELADGTTVDIEKIAGEISKKFGLETAPPSKYIRGMELVGGVYEI